MLHVIHIESVCGEREWEKNNINNKIQWNSIQSNIYTEALNNKLTRILIHIHTYIRPALSTIKIQNEIEKYNNCTKNMLEERKKNNQQNKRATPLFSVSD